MKRQRIYVDTSVLGGGFDPELAPWSNALMQDFRASRFQAVLSEVTAAEVADAPETVRALHAELLGLRADLLPVTTKTLALLRAYEAKGILSVRYRNDMLHIALTSVADVDVLVSWNFGHIVRLDKIRLFGAVNLELGYKPLSIYSPREVATHAEE